MTLEPCPNCMKAALHGVMRREAIQPLPEGALAPEDLEGNPQCYDCASAGTLVRMNIVPTWKMARTAVGNDRQEQYRLPNVPMGLVHAGFVRPSKKGDWERNVAWLHEIGVFGNHHEDYGL